MHRQQAIRSVLEQRTSLIPETLRELSEDKEQQALVQRLQQEGQARLSKEERRKRQRSLDSIGAPPFPSVLKASFLDLILFNCCLTVIAIGTPSMFASRLHAT